MKYLKLTVVFICIQTFAFAKYPVLSRHTKDGGLFGYNSVRSNVTIFSVVGTDGSTKTVTGYTVECSTPGYMSCPRLGAEYLPANPSADWDQVQLNYTDQLMTYAINQIESGNDNGTYSINVQVASENFIRRYSVEWTGEMITIFREDIAL
jgi:hypothetical protein